MSVNKKISIMLSLALFVFFLFHLSPAYAEEGDLRACVVYDAAMRFGIEQPALVSLREYLGHFNLEQRALAVRDWKPGALRDADIVFFLGLRDTKLPRGMLKEIANAKRVVWIERNVEQLAAYLGWKDFKTLERESGWMYLTSGGDESPVHDWLECVVTEPGRGAQVFATLRNYSRTEPLSWKRGNVYYLGCLDFFETSMVKALVDLLYRAIPPAYVNALSKPRQVLMRIEDVSPFVSAETLQELVDAIEQYDIPYAIGVISVGMTESGGEMFLHENPELVEVLQHAQDNGASIIMHGYAHQNEFSPTTGEGWEFWNIQGDRPMDDDEAFTRDRIEKAFIELARCGLYPVAFEAPHYAMSKKGYEILSEYFNVYSGMPQTSDASYEISMTLPFIVRSQHLNGMILLPENMGYYDGVEYHVGDMLNNSKALLATKNSFACFFYHGFLPPDNLRKIIDGVRAQGFSFFDLRAMEIRAESPQVKILVQNGRVSATVDPSLVAQWEKSGFFDPRYDLETLSWIQISILIAVICSFLGIIANLKRTAWRKYEV